MSLPRRSIPLWPFAAIVVLGVRGLVAASRLDELELERYVGNLGWALLQGMPLDTSQLPIIPHLRGSALFGLLAAPLMAVLGPTLVVLKVLAVAVSMLAGGLFTALVQAHIGRAAAIVSVLFMAAAPPAFQMVDVLAIGSHADTIPLLLAPLLILLRAEPGTPLSVPRAVALGCVFGLGLLFSMQLWVAAPALAVAWWSHDRRFVLRARSWIVVLAALPFVALIPVLTRSATIVNKPIESRFFPNGVGGAVERIIDIARGDLVESWLFAENGGALLGIWLAVSLLVGALVACVAIIRRRTADGSDSATRGGRITVLFAFGLTHTVCLFGAYAISDFELNLVSTLDGVGSRYFLPLWPSFGLMALSGVQVLGGGARQLPRLALALGLIVPGALGAIALIDLRVPRGQPPVLGPEPYLFLSHIRHAAGSDLEARVNWIERLDPDWPEIHPWLYTSTFERQPEDGDTRPLREAVGDLKSMDARTAPFVAAAFGAEAALALTIQATRERLEPHVLTQRFTEAAQALPARDDDSLARCFLLGAGRRLTTSQLGLQRKYGPGVQNKDAITKTFGVLRTGPIEVRQRLAEGMGFQFGLRTNPYEAIDRPLLRALDSVPKDVRNDYAHGFGSGYRARFRRATYAPPTYLAIEAELPDWMSAPIREVLANPDRY